MLVVKVLNVMKRNKILISVFALFFGAAIFMSLNEVEKKTEFKVIKVNGQILFLKTGHDLKIGDDFTYGTPLKFVSNYSKAAIVNPKIGRYILQPTSKGKVKILPATTNVTSRSGALINLIDLQNHFNGRYLILGEEKLQIGIEAYPMDENHFFYLKFKIGDESIAKKMSHENNRLILNKENIFCVDGKSIPVTEQEMTIYYRDEDNKKSYKINTFTPVFPDLENLSKEVAILLDNSNFTTSSRKIDEITTFVNEFYGKPQKDNLLNWIEKEFGLVKEQKINFK